MVLSSTPTTTNTTTVPIRKADHPFKTLEQHLSCCAMLLDGLEAWSGLQVGEVRRGCVLQRINYWGCCALHKTLWISTLGSGTAAIVMATKARCRLVLCRERLSWAAFWPRFWPRLCHSCNNPGFKTGFKRT